MRETIQQTLIRKFTTKYIYSNPEFFQLASRTQAYWNSPPQVKQLSQNPDETMTEEAPATQMEPDEKLTKAQKAMKERITVIMTIIVAEVDKFLKTKRLSNSNIQELDKRIAVEIYLREKKEAIIEDRKEPQKEVDTDSNLEKVRARYQGLVQQVEENNQLRKSETQSIARKSEIQSNVRKSINGSVQEQAAELAARLQAENTYDT